MRPSNLMVYWCMVSGVPIRAPYGRCAPIPGLIDGSVSVWFVRSGFSFSHTHRRSSARYWQSSFSRRPLDSCPGLHKAYISYHFHRMVGLLIAKNLNLTCLCCRCQIKVTRSVMVRWTQCFLNENDLSGIFIHKTDVRRPLANCTSRRASGVDRSQ